MKLKLQKKEHLFKESIIATFIVLFITYFISFIPLSQEYGKALHQGFADFDIYDLYYSGKDKTNIVTDSNIVLVEIGSNRREITSEIKTVSRYSPSAIAVDATFEMPGDSLEDYEFSQELKKHSNIILADGFNEKKHFVPNIFCNKNCNLSGYVDFSGNPGYAVIRTYSPFAIINGKKYEAFTSTIARYVNFEKYTILKNRKNNTELINYTGNLNNNFLNASLHDLKTLDSTQLKTLFANKIVLIGFFVKDFPLVMEDLKYSPLNERVSGKSFPDMYGVVVHANILSMILKKNYGAIASKKTSYFLALFITFFLNLYFISQFHKKVHPAHARFMLVQFFLILIILYIFLMIFTKFLYKVPLEPIIIAMVLTLELLGLYKNIALWLHKKFGYGTVFTHKHII